MGNWTQRVEGEGGGVGTKRLSWLTGALVPESTDSSGPLGTPK